MERENNKWGGTLVHNFEKTEQLNCSIKWVCHDKLAEMEKKFASAFMPHSTFILFIQLNLFLIIF